MVRFWGELSLWLAEGSLFVGAHMAERERAHEISLFIFLEGLQSYWLKTLPHDLTKPCSPPRKPHLQIATLRVRASTHEF